MCLTPKAIVRWSLPIFLSLLSVISCTVQKRLYTKGYSIEWKKRFGADHRSEKAVTPETSGQIPFIRDTVLTTESPQPVIPKNKIAKANDLTQAIPAHFSDDTTTHEIIHSEPVVLKKQAKVEKQADPKHKPLHDTAFEFLNEAFNWVTLTLVLLASSALLLYLSATITITILQLIITILAILSLICLAGFAGVVVGFIIVGLICLGIYGILKLIDKMDRKTDEMYSSSRDQPDLTAT